jgi:hypothetical protein
MASLTCRHCGTPVPLDEPLPRDLVCEGCNRDLRACVHCRHYDLHYNNSCRETMADPVVDKDRRNFCEYFMFSREPFTGTAPTRDRAAEARSKLDSLFGGPPKSGPSREEEARRKLENLFKKKSDE